MPQPLQTPLKGITASTLSMLLLLHYLVLHCYSLSYYFLHLWGCCLSFAFSAAKMMVFWRQLAWSFFSFMLSSLNISLLVKISRELISLFILCTLFHWSSPPVKCSTLSRTQCWVKACPSCQVPIYLVLRHQDVSHLLFRYRVPHVQSCYNVCSVHIPKYNVFTDVLYIIVYKGLNYRAFMESLVGLMATSARCCLDICGKTLSPGAERLSIISATADFGFPQGTQRCQLVPQSVTGGLPKKPSAERASWCFASHYHKDNTTNCLKVLFLWA